MKRAVSLLLAGLLLSALPAGTQQGRSAGFAVMSYNICGLCSDEKAPLGAAEIATVARWMKERKVMIAGFQEMMWKSPHRQGRDLAEEIAEALRKAEWPMEYAKANYVYFSNGGFMGNVIFSRWPILESGEHQLAGVGEMNAVIHYVKVEPAKRATLHFFNTHFNITFGRDLHDEQMAEALFFMNRFGGYRMAVADWNFGPESPSYKSMEAAGFRESCKSLHKPGCSRCQTVGQGAGNAKPAPKQGHIDMIWAGEGLKFTDSESPADTYSDHWPIFAAVRPSGKQPPLKERPENILKNSDFDEGLEEWGHTDSAKALEPGRYSVKDRSAGQEGTGKLDFALWQTAKVKRGETYTATAWGVTFNRQNRKVSSGKISIGYAHGKISGPDDKDIVWGRWHHVYPWLRLPLEHKEIKAKKGELTVIVRGRDDANKDDQTLRVDLVELLR